jgi:hypothetical protein
LAWRFSLASASLLICSFIWEYFLNTFASEERLAASMEQIRCEVFRLGRAQQALFAFVDSLAKVLLTCVPGPGGEALDAAVARARGRHAQLLKGAGQSMVGDSQLAMQDLAVRGDG